MKKNLLALLGFLTMGFVSIAQSSNFVGTFVNGTNSISIQFKLVGDEYHGMLASAGASFAIKATGSNSKISGLIYGFNGPLNFEATLTGITMNFRATGFDEPFYKYSDMHSLGNFDLTPYMRDFSAGQGTASNPQSTTPTTPNREQNTNNAYSNLTDKELLNIISGSQLVYYMRTSYVSDSMASSITYVNFCSNGTFTINTDGSFSVEGNYGGNAQGASYGSRSGTWKLVSHEGQPAVFLQYYNGESNINIFNANELRAGRWRRGNTQYALQRNKVRCN